MIMIIIIIYNNYDDDRIKLKTLHLLACLLSFLTLFATAAVITINVRVKTESLSNNKPLVVFAVTCFSLQRSELCLNDFLANHCLLKYLELG